MSQVELFLALLVAVVVATLAVHRLHLVPDAVALTVGGVIAGLLPFAPDVRIDPEIIFVVFLPPILYPAAFDFAAEDVRANLRPVAVLAVGLVLATMAAIGVALHLAAGIPWAAAIAIGAVLAPTDAVAATAIVSSSGAPSRLTTILEGESLINDGTGLTALRISVAAIGGSVGLWSSLGQFVLVAVGGAAVGAVLAFATAWLRRRIDALELESAIAVLLAYGAFVLAERLGVSGVLAVVAAGYVMGRTGDLASAGTRIGGESFWSVTRFLAESILFLLVGIAFANVLSDPAARGAGELAALVAVVVAATLGVRLAWMFAAPSMSGVLTRSGPVAGRRERIVLALAGARGAVSVAGALSLPKAVAGTPFPERSTLVAVAVASIVALLVIPALGLPVALSALGLRSPEDERERERRVRAALAEAALRRTDEVAEAERIPEEVRVRVRERYELRVRRLLPEAPEDHEAAAGRSEHYRVLRDAARQAQRSRLAELRDAGEVHGELLRDLERDLDLEELRRR